MNFNMLAEITYNISLLLALCSIFILASRNLRDLNKIKKILMGLIIGLIGIGIMLNPFHLFEGVIFDVRSVLMVVSGMFFGFLPTIIGGFFLIIFRIIEGGIGVLPGVTVIVCSAAIGIIWRHFRYSIITKRKKYRWLEFYIIGLITHIAMILIMFMLPIETALNTIKNISLPVIIIYPIGTLLISLLLSIQVDVDSYNIRISESEEKYKYIFENSPVGKSLTKPNGELSVNHTFCEMTGYTKEELEGKNWLELTHPEDIEKSNDVIKMLTEGDKNSISFDKRYIKKDGSILWATVNTALRKDENGKPVYFLTSIIDITAQKSAEKELYQTKEDFRVLFEDAPLGYQSLDENGHFLIVNKAWLEMLGYKNEEVIGKWFGNFISSDQIDLFKSNFPKFIANGQTCSTFKMIKKNNQVIKVNFTGKIAYNADGSFRQTHCILENVTGRLEYEAKLKQNEERLRRSQEISKTGTWELEIGSNMIWASDQAFVLFGLKTETNLINIEDVENMICEDDRQMAHSTLLEFMEDKKKYDIEYRIQPFELGDYRYVHSMAKKQYNEKGEVIKILGVIMDITQRKKLEEERVLLEEQVWNHQKLESIGTLASGVAHEINNPINGILNYGQVILDSTESDSEINKYAGEIIYETNRVSEIVKNLLDFSKQSGKQHSYAQIDDIIGKTLSLVNTIFKHDDINLNVDVKENISKLKCRSQQIQQVLMNLLTNARDSLNEKYPGYHENKKINLECREFSKDKRKWLSISIEDFGTGIPDDIKHRIFDPFFTTKDKEKGTGLGLSISYGIIKEHHGEIKVDSKEGEYTKFTLILPCDNGWDINDK